MRDLKNRLLTLFTLSSAVQAVAVLVLLTQGMSGTGFYLLCLSLTVTIAGGIYLVRVYSQVTSDSVKRLKAIINGTRAETVSGSFSPEMDRELTSLESVLRNHTGKMEKFTTSGGEIIEEVDGEDYFACQFKQVIMTINMIVEQKDSMLELSTQSISDLKNMVKVLSSTSANLSNVSFNMAGSARSMKERTGSISDSIGVVSSNLDTVASGAEESSIVISNIVKSTREIAKNIDHISMTIQDLSSSFGEISSKTEEAGKISEMARNRGDEINEKMVTLSEASDRIGKVITVIKEIADQTNMLALNATIEAAGAGDAGKGFAVVANEVKELARQSSEAADDIREIIENIQSNTSVVADAAKEVNSIIKEVSSINHVIAEAVNEQRSAAANISSTISDHTNITKDVSANVEEMSSGATDIARSTADAADRVRKITENIRDIDTDSTNTAKGVEENNNAVKKLIDIAQSIQTLVDKSGTGTDRESDIPDLFPWSDKYSVGVASIDKQHQKLVGMINELNAAMVTEQDFQVLDDIVTRMLEYTIYHFSSEEEKMTSAEYPEIESHKAKHVELIEDVQGYYNKLKNGDIDTPAVLSFLKDWLNHHILKVDMAYSSHMNNKGIV